MKFRKIIINDTIIIDDIDETYICIYFNEFMNDNEFIPITIYINRFDGKIKNINHYNDNDYGIEWNNFKIINKYDKINLEKYNFNVFIKNNRFVIDKSLEFKIYIPVQIKSFKNKK